MWLGRVQNQGEQRPWPPGADGQAGAETGTLGSAAHSGAQPRHLTPAVWPLTSKASAMVMSTAQAAMPARPMRCSVRRPARSTTNSCGQRECQCRSPLVPLWTTHPRGPPPRAPLGGHTGSEAKGAGLESQTVERPDCGLGQTITLL